MAVKSNIQWTDATWNIARGCTKVDEDCKFCYMYRESLNGTRYEPKQVIRTKTVFNLPLKIKQPSKIFTSSLTDFFHEDCDPFRDEAWDIIRKCPRHTFQILTKRPDRIYDNVPRRDAAYGSFVDVPVDSIWIGTSIGSVKGMKRKNQLVNSGWPGLKFLSIEPLYEKLIFDNLLGIQWVIVGGESGNENGMYRYRECKLEWIESIVDQCKAAGVPVFVKQLGTHLAKQLKLSDRHGGNIEEWPEHLRVREFPKEVKKW